MLLLVDGLALYNYTQFGFAMKPTADIDDGMGKEDGGAMTRGGRPG